MTSSIGILALEFLTLSVARLVKVDREDNADFDLERFLADDFLEDINSLFLPCTKKFIYHHFYK